MEIIEHYGWNDVLQAMLCTVHAHHPVGTADSSSTGPIGTGCSARAVHCWANAELKFLGEHVLVMLAGPLALRP